MARSRGIIAVTGATGFIGANLCRQLANSGYRVRALVRRPPQTRFVTHSGIDLVQGNLEDSQSVARLVAGCAAVVHCAGAVRGRNLNDFLPANVTGTGNLVAAAGTLADPPRLLLLSSLAAREPRLSPYAMSKRRAEELALSESAVAVTVIRPPPVYGPGDRELLPLFRAMARGFVPLPGNPQDRLSLIYVDDLTAAIIAWLELDTPPREIFTISDPVEGGYSWAEIVDIASRVFNRRIRVLPIHKTVLRAIAGTNMGLSRVFRYPPMFTTHKVREILHPDWCCDAGRLGSAFGWHPQIDFDAGLRLTCGRLADSK